MSNHTHSNAGKRRRAPTVVRRAEILDRASDLAADMGLGQLTMKRVAARVGFSEAAIYRHFPTKQALLIGLMDRLDEHLLRPVQLMAARTDLPAISRLELILSHHLSLVFERHSLPIQLLAEASAGGDPVMLARMRGIMRAYLDTLVRLVDLAVKDETLPADTDPAIVALWMLGGPAAMAIQHRLRLDPSLERRISRAFVPEMFRLLRSADRRTT